MKTEQKKDIYDISMVVPGMPFGPLTLEQKSLGGSESAALYMANALQKSGNRVTVYNNIDQQQIDPVTGVRYVPFQFWDQLGRHVPHDVCIVQRGYEVFAHKVNARLNYLWCHDLPNPDELERFKGVTWNIDKVMLLSDYMVKEYKRVYKLDDREIFQTRNGVDVQLIKSLKGLDMKRDRKNLLYCARPERGLDVLLNSVFPKILQAVPDAKLYLATYDNNVEHLRDFYAFCDSMAEKFGKSVTKLGALTKRQLYSQMLTSGVYVYPTPSPISPKFNEVSCISVMESMACGLPVICSDRGALGETLQPQAGFLVQGDNLSSDYASTFAQHISELVSDEQLYDSISQAGSDYAKNGLGWDAVAEQWGEQIASDIAVRNDDPCRLARHLWRMSDIVAADNLIDSGWGMDRHGDAGISVGNRNLIALSEVIDRDFNFYRTDDGMREQYERIGETHDSRVIDWCPREARYMELRKFLQQHVEVNTVLDYGCAHGGYMTNLAKEVGRKWTGIDIDKHSIAMAQDFAEQLAVTAQCDFVVGDAMKDEKLVRGDYDMVLMQEVLEHVRAPWRVIERMEKSAKRDGLVYITVPFGPWEYESYFNYPWRCHIWHFDMHDLYDMCGDKPGFDLNVLLHGRSNDTGEMLGWWILTYRADHEPIPQIDMERKLRIQRPRQTVSVSVMGGPGAEEQMRWTLNSVKHVADEIIFVDTGLSDEGKRVAEEYATKLVHGPDPKVFGFETPRNKGLENCSMDWVFWIDLDERLIDPVNVHKYLRENTYDGYGVRQHHFACDTSFPPDMPVRLFRNRPKDGKSMRFYGMVHEHPEYELNEGPGAVLVLADAHIAHTGYLIESTRQGRFARNYPMLQADIQKYPDRLLQKHFIMRDNILMNRYEMRMNGGRLSPEMKRRAEEVVELGKKYFVGKSSQMSSDSLAYYSEALGMLGRGFEIALSMSGNKIKAQPNGTEFMRFEAKDDFLAELTRRAESVIEPLTRSL